MAAAGLEQLFGPISIWTDRSPEPPDRRRRIGGHRSAQQSTSTSGLVEVSSHLP
jgi:hypothetical protein